MAPEAQVNGTANGDQLEPAIASAPDGSFLICWQSTQITDNGLDVYCQRFDADGVKVAGELLVNDHVGGDQRRPAVTYESDGGFAVIWESLETDSDGFGIRQRRFNAKAKPKGNPITVNRTFAGGQVSAAIGAFATGQRVTVWQSDGQDGDQGGIYFRVLEN